MKIPTYIIRYGDKLTIIKRVGKAVAKRSTWAHDNKLRMVSTSQ